MRLIDAEALKDTIIEPLNVNDVGKNDWYEGYYTAKNEDVYYIDNAPTVIPDNDIFEWCTDCKEYDQEKHCCHRWSSKIRETIEEIKQCKLDELRPKGEWVELPKAFDIRELPCKCSSCGHILSFMNHYPKSSFCPNCGADMRGKEE